MDWPAPVCVLHRFHCRISITVYLSVLYLILLLQLAKVGSSVKWTKGTTDEENHGVIVTTVTDSQANIININTRQSHSVCTI